MPLNPQLIDIPFGLGIDTRTDEKNVLPGKLITLENAAFDKVGRVSKRPGFGAGALTTESGRIYTNENEIIVREADDTATPPSQFGRSRTQNAAGQVLSVSSGAMFSRLEGDLLTAFNENVVTVDGAMNANRDFGMVAATDVTGVVTLTMFDYNTKRPIIVSRGSSGGSFVNARVLPSILPGRFIVGAYYSSGLVIYDSMRSNGTPGGGGVAITGGVGNLPWGGGSIVANASITANATPRWDWVLDALGQFLFVATLDTAGTSLVVTRYDTATYTSTTLSFAVAGVTSLAIGLSGSTVGVIWSTSAGLFYRGYAANPFALVTTTTTVHNVAGTYELCTLVGSTVPSGGTFIFQLQESATPTASYNRRVLSGQCSTVGVGAVSNTVRGCGIASKTGPISTTAAGTYDTLLQRSLMFRRYQFGTETLTDFPFQGRTFYQRHGGLIQNHCVPNGQDLVTANPGEYDFFTAQLVSQESTATAVATTPNYGAAWVQAQQQGGLVLSAGKAARPFPSAQVNGRTIFGGGALHRITPKGVEVIGLLTFPEIVSVTPATTGGSLVDGQYGVICTYETVSDDGNVWESAPSVPMFAAVSGSSGAGQLTVVVQTYRMVQRPAVYIVFYRTLNGGTTYYRERRVLATLATDSMSQALTLVAASLSQAGILYAQGEQENSQPDSPIALCADQDRLWVTPGSSRSRVLPSKPIIAGVGVAFFPEVFRQIQSQGDFITNLVRQDEKLIAFKTGTTYIASGRGPDQTGNNDDLSEFSELFNNIGAESVISVVKAAVGVYVKNATDIWFIGRDLQQNRIGADVESLCATQNLLGAVYCAAQRQVRWLYGNGTGPCFELVYDEEAQQWSYNTRPSAISSTGATMSIGYFNGQAVYLYPNTSGGYANLVRESPITFSDNANEYSFKLVTAWLKPAQVLQGFGRIYKGMLLGSNFAASTMQVRVRFDYETTWSETHVITSANATINGTAYQPELRFIRQKCEAFQLEISDINPSGQGFNLAGLELTVGVKPGSNRLNQAKRF